MSLLKDLQLQASLMSDDELREAIMDMRSRRRSSIVERAVEQQTKKNPKAKTNTKVKLVVSRADLLTMLELLGDDEDETETETDVKEV